jgi:hypothetical protein
LHKSSLSTLWFWRRFWIWRFSLWWWMIDIYLQNVHFHRLQKLANCRCFCYCLLLVCS